MAAFNRFRLFHWLLAGFFVAVYLSGDDAEQLHIWLGYGLVVLLVLRLLMAPLRPAGFPRLLPPRSQWRRPSLSAAATWLTFGALTSFALASLIGLGMVDNGDVLAALPGIQPDLFGAASDINFVGWMSDAEEVHEFFANLALWLIALHIGYVLLFRRGSVGPMLKGLPKASPAADSKPTSTLVANEWVRLQVGARQAEASDACSFTLHVSAAQHARFIGHPGQFLTLKVPCAEPPLLRCYSLSQWGRADGSLRITVKRVPDGRASNWLIDHLQAGEHIEVLPPVGQFVPDTLDDNILLLGAGSGITPLRSILEAVLSQGRGRVFLFFSSRDAGSLIFADELADFSMRYPRAVATAHLARCRAGHAEQPCDG